MKRVLLLAACVASLFLVAAPGVAPGASACGFNEDLADVGTAHVYLQCTRPRADVHPDEPPHLP